MKILNQILQVLLCFYESWEGINIKFFEKTRFAFYVLRFVLKNNHLGEGIRDSLSDNLIHSREWFKDFEEIFIPIKNESGLFRKNLVDLAVLHENNSGKWCLVSEPPGVGKEISHYLKKNYDLDR
jgi:hypothetical protein